MKLNKKDLPFYAAAVQTMPIPALSFSPLLSI